MTGSHIEEVARVYDAAVLSGRAPLKAVANAFAFSQSTATRRVAEARAAGLLATDARGTNPQMRAIADDLGVDVEVFRRVAVKHSRNGEVRFRV